MDKIFMLNFKVSRLRYFKFVQYRIALDQGWAFLRYMTAINYLDMKMLDDKTEIS
jgi:hypothetical protein